MMTLRDADKVKRQTLDLSKVDGWSILSSNLSRDAWTKPEAISLCVGIKPTITERMATATEWEPMIPSLFNNWKSRSPEQTTLRLQRRWRTLQVRLSTIPNDLRMTPYAWLAETLRDHDRRLNAPPGAWDQKRRGDLSGIVPPWLPAARRKKQLQYFLPPESSAERFERRLGEQFQVVYDHWEAWVLGEQVYANKGAFIRFISAGFTATSEKAVREWIERWERDTYTPYGRLETGAAAASNASQRGYGPPLLERHGVVPVKRARTSR
jgi:hypothetical protein